MRRLIGAALVVGVMAGSAIAEPPSEVDTETRAESLERDALALAIIGGVTLSASAYFAFQASRTNNLIAAHPTDEPWPESIRLQEEQGERFQTWSGITAIVGVGLVATSAVCWWRSRSAREEPVTVAPIATPSTVGVAFSGGF
jgi:hypothetical protein